MILKPRHLKEGDTVGIIAPASTPCSENLILSINFLKKLGLKVKFGQYINSTYGYLAGKDEERLEDLHRMFLDEEIKGIICARGGYGTARIASSIDYEIVRQNPKIFWGYSDITFLHTAFYQCAGLVTFHGPMLSSDIVNEDANLISIKGFEQLFKKKTVVYTEEISPLETMIEGNIEGTIIGGNLSLLTSTLGTPFEIDTKNKILFIEDVNEEPFHVDRMLNQLLCSGKLTQAAGILICDFNKCISKGSNPSFSIDEIISHYIRLANRPTLKGFKIGHCSPNVAIPIGVKAEMNTVEKKVIIESGVI